MGHKWHFFRAGGVDQVSLRSGADLLALRDLDQTLWVALAMPTRDVDIDPATLDLLDEDKDRRIRVPDVLAAIDWIEATWVDPGEVLRGSESIALASIRAPEVQKAARRILSDAGKGGVDAISVADVAAAAKQMAATRFNGDGVVTPATAADDDTRKAIEEVMAAVGTVTDRSGATGVDQEKVDGFFEAIDEAAAWMKEGEAAAARPLGDATAAAADALSAIEAKLDDYFARCRLAAFDPRAAAGLNGQEADFTALGGKQLSASADDIARLPLARVEAGRPLPLGAGVNPAWTGRLASFVDAAVEPILGPRDSLREDDLAAIVGKLAPHRAWAAKRPGHPAAALPAERIHALADGPARATIGGLIAEDAALADEYAAIASVDKLVRLQRDFGRILRNFVNFAGFYSERDAVFQAGTLYIDGRACNLCVPVSDAGKHGALAGLSGAYLAYCDLARGAEKRTIAAAITNGDADHLMVGRNAVFYDRAGKDWDATVSKIVANPISVREAFWAPYKKLARMIEEQTAKRAAAAEAEATTKVEGAATAIAHADKQALAKAPPPAPAKPEPKKIDVGTVAAIGVAIGGIGAMVVGILSMFLGLGLWMPIGILALLLLVSGPSMLLAWLKLRQRNLGPILDANGWAINGRARVNVRFGAALTDLAALPPGARRSLDDPYADKRRPWRLYTVLAILLVLAGTWYVGRLDRYLPHAARSTTVLGEHAPAAKAPQTP
jgi:hypothetical protein